MSEIEIDLNNPIFLTRLRNAFKYNQKELGELVGVKPNTISCWERGVRRPSGSAKILIGMLVEDAKKERLI